MEHPSQKTTGGQNDSLCVKRNIKLLDSKVLKENYRLTIALHPDPKLKSFNGQKTFTL